jgi:hypothetical protein
MIFSCDVPATQSSRFTPAYLRKCFKPIGSVLTCIREELIKSQLGDQVS